MSLSIIQLVLLALLVMLAAVLIKKYQPEISLLLCIGICILIFVYVLQAFGEWKQFLQYITGGMNLQYLGVLVRLLGLAYVCEFASGLCKDAGYQSISGQIEIAGRIGMLVVSLPILRAIIETIYGFFG